MARTCEICGKIKSIGHTRKLLRGNYNITAKRPFRPNLQKTIYQGKRVDACAKCIRTLAKQARV